MIDDIFQEIMDRYPRERIKLVAGNLLAEAIRNEIPQFLISNFLK